MPKKEPIIQVQGVQKAFGNHTLFDDISFRINKGEIVALIGPNGSGKTTLARMILGLDKQNAGSILVKNKKSTKQQHLFGYIPQRFAIDRTLPITVEEFLFLVNCKTCKHKDRPLAIKKVLKDVDMAGTEKQRLGTLSGGQLQRVLIARVLMHNRDIMVLDEPSAGVDVTGETAIYELIKNINKEHGTTCIIISHEMSFVFKYATQVLCINKKLLCAGAPKDALTKDVMEELFGSHMTAFHHSH